MSWRVAESLLKLRDQINQASPNRNKSSDGTIGDAAHASRNSDHNPWVKDKSMGIVTALDITHDPSHNVDCNRIVEQLVKSHDSRIKYIIWNKRIYNPSVTGDWRTYNGSNPHTKHFHLSVKNLKKLYDDTSDWLISLDGEPAQVVEPKVIRPLLKRGSKGEDVKVVQKFLNITADGIFGPATESAVKDLQKKNKLTADGIVGPYTWDLIDD